MNRTSRGTISRGVIAGLTLAGGLVSVAAPPPPHPNIVILYADDMGYGDLGANNPASRIPTPNLDRLAASGVRFTDAHSSSGICTPSRYALLTGRHHWRDFHGIVNAFGKPVFKEGQLTLPAMLREKGYETAAIGKWHLGWDWDVIRKPGTPLNSIKYGDFDWSKPVPGGPLDRGFNHYFGDDVINFPPYAWIEDNKLVKAPDTMLNKAEWKSVKVKEGSWECRPGPMVSGWDPYQVLPTLTRRGVDYIRSRKGSDKPFFLYFAFPSPHAPIIPSDEFDGKSKAGPFGDYVFQTDHTAGQLLGALEESGLAGNTIVVFSADNGPENYAYARDEKYDHWSSAPFRGLKRDLYEGGHHVPFLIRWPGVTKPGSVTDALLSQVDLMATLASTVGYALPRNAAEDSCDFLPYLRGEVKAGPRTAIVHNTSKDQYALREGDWLLVAGKSGYNSKQAPAEWNTKHHYAGDDDLPVELFNLKEDAGQRHNLAGKHPERVEAMQALLNKMRVKSENH
jgi:arylsulfatase A